ncbi:hypothetical protein Tco_0699105 [Tanacetum coccineum]
MTVADSPPTILLSDKLSTVTHHHLLTRAPVKLDLDNWNYASWEYFFKKLCQRYEVDKYIHGSPNYTTTSTPTLLIPEELKVDTIVLSWIFTTLSDDLQARLHGCLGKIESIATILTSLGSPVSSEDVVTFSLKGLPDKYDHICDIMHHRDTFPDLKTARSMLTTEEMQLKSKSQSLLVDSSSSSPMVLMAESRTCRFGDGCKFVHDQSVHAKSGNSSRGSQPLGDSTHELLVKLLDKLSVQETTPVAQNNVTKPVSTSSVNPDPMLRWATRFSPCLLLATVINAVSPGSLGSIVIHGQATILSHDFAAGTLHDLATGA